MGSQSSTLDRRNKLSYLSASDELQSLKKSPATPAHLVDPPGARASFSTIKLRAISEQRRQTLLQFSKLKKSHVAGKAAQMVGCSIPTLWRWQQRFNRRGLAGLLPRLSNCGRRSPFELIRLTVKAERELEKLIAQSGSARAAWRQFALNPVCPPMIARQVRRTGKAPAQFVRVGQLAAVQARVLVSADGRRLFVKLPSRGTVSTQLRLPPNFKPVGASK